MAHMHVFTEGKVLVRPQLPAFLLNCEDDNPTGAWIARAGIPEKNLIL